MRLKPRAVLLNVAVAVIGLIVLFPLLWMLSVSFMATGEAATFPPPLLPKIWTLEHYRDLFVNQGMGRYMWNSLALATMATVLALGFTVPAGYAFAKLAFKGRDRLFQMLIGALVIPAQIGTLPLFLMLKSMGLVNTYAGALVPWLASIFGLFLVRQYALDYGNEGIRANAVNADRIRSGLLTEDMIASRSKLRGLSEQAYMRGNLLGREVAAEDVAQAFLAQALALKTTADVTTVDGGNIAAALR